MLGPRLNPNPGLGDHAERSFRSEQHPVGARAGAGAGESSRLPEPARRDRADRLNEVVDVGEARCEVAAGAGCDPAAERRALERLWVEAHRQAVLAELLFEPWPAGAGADQRRARNRINFEHLIEPPKVERTSSVEARRNVRLDAADDAGATPVRNHRDVRCGGPLEQLLDLLLVGRPRNDVGNVLIKAAEGANCVEIGAAVAMFGALLFALRTERRERARRGLNRWCGKLNALKRHRSFGRLRREAKERLNPGRGRLHLGGADRGVLETPPPTAALTLAHA